jgi:hypothetical protein
MRKSKSRDQSRNTLCITNKKPSLQGLSSHYGTTNTQCGSIQYIPFSSKRNSLTLKSLYCTSAVFNHLVPASNNPKNFTIKTIQMHAANSSRPQTNG